MKLYKLKYIEKNVKGLSASSFENKEKIDYINLDFFVSIDELQSYYTVLSGKFIDKYSMVIISNTNYYITEKSYIDLINTLKKI